MDFQGQIEKAKNRSSSFQKKIASLRLEKKDAEAWLERSQTWLNTLKNELNALARDPDPGRVSGRYYREPLGNWESRWTDPKYLPEYIERCKSKILSAQNLIERIEEKIQHLTETKYEVDYWVLEKEEKWGRIKPGVLKEQILQIYTDAEDLSRFILGRKVGIAFDMKDGAPLGYVPIHWKGRKSHKKRTIYLSKQLIEDQAEHLTDLYRALLIHELGHLLLHLKPDKMRYWKVRSAMNDKISVDPVFFQIFNVLLDEQLERILRDVKKEWRVWFNHLEFYARRIDLWELKKMLASSLKSTHGAGVDPRHVDLTCFEEKGYIKVYKHNSRHFAVILSPEFLTLPLGFSRPYAFYYVLRHPISRETVEEPWLRDCLSYVPKKFKSLDLFSLHRLTVKIYERMQEEAALLTSMTVVHADGAIEKIPVPGEWKSEQEIIDPYKPKPEKRRGFGSADGGLDISVINRSRRVDPPPNPEGEPLPPVMKKERFVQVKQHPGHPGGSKPWRSGWSHMWGDLLGEGESKGGSRKRRGSQKSMSAKEALQHKLQSGKLSAKEKSRLKKEIKKEEQKHQQENEQKIEHNNEKKWKEASKYQSFHTPKDEVPPPKSWELNAIERKLDEPFPTWDRNHSEKNMADSLNAMLDTIRKEHEKARTHPVKIREMTAEKVAASDFKNSSDTREYPALENIKELAPNLLENRAALLRAKKFVPVLRPFFAVYNEEKELEERLYSGRHILPSGIKKYVIYGETRIFKDQRFVDMEEYGNVHITLLVDTSASMNNNHRMDQAKGMVTILSECLVECLNLESLFLGYNQSVYICGTHLEHSVSSLAPRGKTNEAAALDYVLHQVGPLPHPIKVVIVLSDGLPTSCSVESVRHLVASMEKKSGFRFLYGALSDEQHPAYKTRVNLKGEMDRQKIISFGKAVLALLR